MFQGYPKLFAGPNGSHAELDRNSAPRGPMCYVPVPAIYLITPTLPLSQGRPYGILRTSKLGIPSRHVRSKKSLLLKLRMGLSSFRRSTPYKSCLGFPWLHRNWGLDRGPVPSFRAYHARLAPRIIGKIGSTMTPPTGPLLPIVARSSLSLNPTNHNTCRKPATVS